MICCNPDFLLQIPKKKGPRIHKGGDHCMGNNAGLAEISLENTCEAEQLRWTRMTKYLLRSQFTACQLAENLRDRSAQTEDESESFSRSSKSANAGPSRLQALSDFTDVREVRTE